MTETKPRRDPKYRRQKRPNCADTAFVELSGRRIQLGRYDSPESWERYYRILAEWNANGRRLHLDDPTDARIVELAAAFWRHAEERYRKPDGTPTSTLHNYQAALRHLKRLYGSTPVAGFGPTQLKTCREGMIAAGWCRGTVNKVVNLLRAVFKWGVSEGIVPVEVHTALCSVKALEYGRSEAGESDPKRPVRPHDIDAVKPHVSRQIWSLIQLQLCTAARPGELLCLRAVDLDTTGTVWTYTPSDHKTRYRGHKRTIYIGPRGQDILREFMADRPIDRYLFSPQDAVAERAAKAATHRRPGQEPTKRKTGRIVHDHYNRDSYRRAIRRACELAGVTPWHPNRLRHNAASRLRAEYGIDVAQTILGHRLGSGITEIYAEANVTKAVDAIAKIG